MPQPVPGQGEILIRVWLDGFFWFPRTLMGFDKLMLAFYDQPELIHQINSDLTDFNLSILDRVFRGIMPGDNIVWQIDAIEDYAEFVGPYARYAAENRQRTQREVGRIEVVAEVEDLREPGPGPVLILPRAVVLLAGCATPITAGVDAARGVAVVIIDADLQDDPAAVLSVAARLKARGVTLSVVGIGTPGGAPLQNADGHFAQDSQGRSRLARLDAGRYDVLFPTHEQVYLLARVADRFRGRVGLAVPA